VVRGSVFAVAGRARPVQMDFLILSTWVPASPAARRNDDRFFVLLGFLKI
jgi:hypothetical protein